MCNSATCQHDDLNDDLTDIFGLAPVGDAPVSYFPPSPTKYDTTLADAQQFRMHEEKCSKCRGTGRFVGYTGRVMGNCFACKGKGVLIYRQSFEQRAKAREQAATRKLNNAAAAEAAWMETNSEDHAWIIAKAGSFDFAKNMLEALRKYGSLTEKQLATVTRLRIADAERQVEFAAEKAAREANAASVDVSRIEQAFESARSNGLKWPKVYLAGYKFTLAPATGKNAGSIYVTLVESDQYLGKITDGRFYRVRECSAEQEAEIVAVASDPKAAAVAYGKQTGRCSCCGRELTNQQSIDMGIGPICAEKYGW